MKTILVDAVNCFIVRDNSEFKIFSDMYEMLEQFPNKKIVLTEANDSQMKQYGLDNLPYEFFTLKHDPEKTNPEYYRNLLAKYSLENNDVIYFEHNVNAVTSAKSIGINTYHYDNEKRDLKELKNFLNINLI